MRLPPLSDLQRPLYFLFCEQSVHILNHFYITLLAFFVLVSGCSLYITVGMTYKDFYSEIVDVHRGKDTHIVYGHFELEFAGGSFHSVVQVSAGDRCSQHLELDLGT